MRSVIEGSDFGDNLMSTLPDVIGMTVGNTIAGGIQAEAQVRKAQEIARGYGLSGDRDSREVRDLARELRSGRTAAQIRASIDDIRNAQLTPVDEPITAHSIELAPSSRVTIPNDLRTIDDVMGGLSLEGTQNTPYLGLQVSRGVDLPQTAASPASTAPVQLTNAEKISRLRAIIPDAAARISQASNNTALDAAERADLQAAATALSAKGTQYKFGPIANQPTAAAGAGMQGGKGVITINPSAVGLFNADGTVNTQTLDGYLAHEARHIYDNLQFKLPNGPTNLAESRRTERNAYRTQAAYLKSVGATSYTVDPAGVVVPLTSSTANFAAEQSVKSWVNASAISATKFNRKVDANYKAYLNNLTAYDRANNTKTTPLPKQKYMPVPIYTPPSSY